MKFKRLFPIICLSSLCCGLGSSISAKMDGEAVTETDFNKIVETNFFIPIEDKMMDELVKFKIQNTGKSILDYMKELSTEAYKFYSMKKLSEFSSICDEVCNGVKELKYFDCFTVSTYFSSLLDEAGIQNGVVYLPCWKNANGNSHEHIDTYSLHSLVIYAYKDSKGDCYYQFADPYNYVVNRLAKKGDAYNKLHMNLSTVLSSKTVGAYDNWILSDDKKSPFAIPLWNWISEASKKHSINIEKYQQMANSSFNCANKFKTLIKNNGKWMIKEGEEEIDPDRFFEQETALSLTNEDLKLLSIVSKLVNNNK